MLVKATMALNKAVATQHQLRGLSRNRAYFQYSITELQNKPKVACVQLKGIYLFCE